MLVIRMQRTGRRGLAQYRVVVQDSRRTPTSGKFVATLGHYDPHTKDHAVDIERAKFYIDHGAQPSDRVAKFLADNGVTLPKWVTVDSKKTKAIKNSEKLRKNRPAEESAETEEVAEPEPVAAETEEPTEDAPQESQASEEKVEEPASEADETK